ncbi:MAG: hypothetical protein ACRDMZ_12745, partial [Solirubrobacteraceae bacterium]
MTAFAALAALAVSSSTASAGILVASAPSCDDQPLSQPFTPWLDYMSYTPLPGGAFESGAPGWSRSGRASIASGNSPFGAGDRSLALDSGASATSAAICVGINHPTIRFFAKRRSTGLLAGLSTVRVDVLFELSTGTVVSLPIGLVLGNGSWQPMLPMLAVANLLPLLPGEH